MAVVKQHKVVASLPDPLEADSIYYVRAGDGVDVYVTNGAGMVVAYPVNVGGGGLTLFTESVSTAAPNNTVPANSLAPVSAAANVDFVIAPKGDGAILAQVPDGTATGGNKRGAGAVDLQFKRYIAAQVATGTYSFSAGESNCPSGRASSALGRNGYPSGDSSFTAGYSNSASGDYAICLGVSNKASGRSSVAAGQGADTRFIASAIAEASFSGRQAQRLVLYGDTSSSTPTTLKSDGNAPRSTNQLVLPNSSAYYCRIRVIARNTSTHNAIAWAGSALVRRGTSAASTTLIGSSLISEFGDTSMASCSVALYVDTALGSLAIEVAGLTSTVIRWAAQIETVEAA